MPVPEQRDAAAFRRAIEPWLASKLGCDGPVSVAAPTNPKGVGNSNETIIFQAIWRGASGPQRATLVARIAPTGFQVMLEPRFLESMQVQRALALNGRAPTPKVLWSEADPAILGAPFYVMAHVVGRVPTDNPPYNAPGSWLAQASPDHRERLWLNAMDAFCALHRSDLAGELDLPLRPPAPGSSGLETEFDYWTRFLRWAGEGQAHPIALIARDWLVANLPGSPPTAFAWGDPRIENMMFDDDMRCAAILDWELACLAGPLSDLGWWLFMDRQACESGGGHPRLEGLGDRARTIEVWRAATGVPTDDIEWYEVFAGYRNVACITRIISLLRAEGRTLPDSFSLMNNATLRVLRVLLATKPPEKYGGLVPFT